MSKQFLIHISTFGNTDLPFPFSSLTSHSRFPLFLSPFFQGRIREKKGGGRRDNGGRGDHFSAVERWEQGTGMSEEEMGRWGVCVKKGERKGTYLFSCLDSFLFYYSQILTNIFNHKHFPEVKKKRGCLLSHKTSNLPQEEEKFCLSVGWDTFLPLGGIVQIIVCGRRLPAWYKKLGNSQHVKLLPPSLSPSFSW